MVTAINDLGARRQTLETEISTERQKNERLEQLGNESHNALIAKIEELNQLTNKTQLDRERLHAMERVRRALPTRSLILKTDLRPSMPERQSLHKSRSRSGAQLAQADDLLQEKIQAYNEITAQVLACSEQIEEERNEMFALHSRALPKKAKRAAWRATAVPCKSARRSF